VALVTAIAMALGAFAGSAAAKKVSKTQKAAISKQLRKQIKKNPRVIRSKKFLRRAALVNFKLPVTIRIRGDCPAGAGGAAFCPAGDVNTALNERSQYTADVDLGPSLGQRKVSIAGSLAAEVTFRDTYDGGALGNVSIEILPSSTKTIRTSSVPLLWNPDVDSQSSRVDANFARASIRAGASVAPLLTAHGWDNKIQGCTDHKNETALSSRTFALASTFGGGGPTSDGSYSALWYGTTGIPGPNSGLPGIPVVDPAGPGGTTGPSYYLPVFPGTDDGNNLAYGVTFNTPVLDPDEYLGPLASPFPYPAIDPDPYSAGTQTGNPPTTGIPANDPTIASNARDTVLRTNALNLSIAATGTQVDLATGTPIAPNTLPTGQGSQNVIIGKSGGEANLFGNIPGKGYGIDVTVSLATRINSIFRIQDQDVFNTPLTSFDQYPAGVFNCRQIWSGAVQNYIPGIRLSGSLRISPAITKDGKLRIAKASVDTIQPTHTALSACLMPYTPYSNDNPAGFPTTGGAGGPGSTPKVPTYAEAVGGTPSLLTTGPLSVLPYNSDQLPANIANSTAARRATPSDVACNTTPHPLIRDSSLYGSVEPMVAASAANGYTTTSSGAQATVAGDISVTNLLVDVLIGDQ
jgi:hypothetical protein